jgi:hypothetical protein
MSEQNPFRLFVSHVWEPDEEYHRVFEYLESARNFFYSNCGDPEKSPGPDKEARRAVLRREIEQAEVVIFLSRLFGTHPVLLEYQLNAALAMNKPIIALAPFGGEGIPEPLAGKADEIAEWDSRSIEDAIRRCARHEETQRWDVIEWDPD